jgi:AcrR family transcriptional regulator
MPRPPPSPPPSRRPRPSASGASAEPRRRGEPVVRRVLEVTLAELGRVGLAALSLPHVAERAGIHKTSLYRRWPDKETLVAAALALATPTAAELPDEGSAEADLVALALGLARFVGSPAGAGLVRAALADGDVVALQRLAGDVRGRAARRGPRAILERACARGELREDVSFDLVLHTLAGGVLHRVLVERRAADRRWAVALVRLLLDGAARHGRRIDARRVRL